MNSNLSLTEIWGQYKIFVNDGRYRIRELIIDPGQIIEDTRNQCSIHWFSLIGSCNIYTEYLKQGLTVKIVEGNTYSVSSEVNYKLINDSEVECRLLEICYSPKPL